MTQENPFPTNPSSMEPMLPRRNQALLYEIAATLIKKTSALGARLHPRTAASMRELLRSMNSYYSNLIEGHSTHPLSIDRALKNEFEKDPKKKNLQLLALAHIEVQKLAEARLSKNPHEDVSSPAYIKWLHLEFYNRLPAEFLEVKKPGGGNLILTPGELRREAVEVGVHLPPRSGDLERFLSRFHEVYSDPNLDPLSRIIAIAASHHRLAWIHPFLDENGRVLRLHSDSFFYKEGLGGFGLWTISRGLSRNKQRYYELLAKAGDARKGDFDGRGALSDESLHNFCLFFLETSLEQVEYISKMLDLSNYENRLQRFVHILADFTKLKENSFYLLRDLFLRGEIPRGEAHRILNVSERSARDVVGELIALDLIRSETPKSELYLHFHPLLAAHLFPSLFPENVDLTPLLFKKDSF